MLRRRLRQIHWPLVFPVLGLMALGTLFIQSAAVHDYGDYAVKQIFWFSAASVVFLFVSFFSYRTFLSISYLLYAVALFFLVWVLIAGHTRLGAQRWVDIGPFAFQPSEFAKLATGLALANFLGSHYRWEGSRVRTFLIAVLIAGAPFLLIVRQPDLGSAILFLPLAGSLLFLWGIRYRTLLFSIFAGVVAAPLFWQFLKVYQKKRILVFLDPRRDPLGSGYTAIQSRIAVGSGGLFGKGYLAGTQSQLQFVPEHHTDFIFCVIGEEWGFAGSALLLILYALLFHAAFQVIEQTTDMKAKLLASGMMGVMFAQVFINVGMTFGMMPITGITLPLVSYGGSSLVATAVALGLILSIYKERSIF